MATYTNSSLVNYKKLSPNYSKRTYTGQPDVIVIHCMAGNLSVESCGALFAKSSTGASSHYGIGTDGRIGMYVEEKNRAWATGGKLSVNGWTGAKVDHRAITIEVANNGGSPNWPVSTAAYNSLIALVADICKRNNIKKLIWKGDKSLVGNWDKQNMAVHRWFASKACPGDYLYNHMGDIASKVNAKITTVQSTAAKEDSKVTQAEFNKMMENWLAAKGNEATTWEKDAVQWARENNILRGSVNGSDEAKRLITRGEVIVLMQRMMEALKK